MRGGERKGHRQPRRPESRAPNGPSALRAYSPARTAAAEAAPNASWAFFCAASEDDDVEANRRGALARSRARNVVDCMTCFCSFFFGKKRVFFIS